MGTTSKWSIRYPELADPADITQIKNLATDADTAITAAQQPAVGIHRRLAGDAVTIGLNEIPFASSVTNVGAWNVSADSTVFFPPMSGLYFITLTCWASDGASGIASIFLGDAQMGAAISTTVAGSGYGEMLVCSVLLPINAGQYLHGTIYSANYIRLGAFYTTFSAHMVAKL